MDVTEYIGRILRLLFTIREKSLLLSISTSSVLIKGSRA